MPRPYRLGKRQPAVDATARSIVTAARELVQESSGEQVSVAKIARRAGVSRITVYNRFGSRQGVLRALAAPAAETAPIDGNPKEALRLHLAEACARWAADPALYRNLPALSPPPAADGRPRLLAERLAAEDLLRPGCSLREAEDVIATLSSFAVFDRLHHDGRRPPAAVAEVLMRLGAAILA
jgi:AcrR family transcriptional regulator